MNVLILDKIVTCYNFVLFVGASRARPVFIYLAATLTILIALIRFFYETVNIIANHSTRGVLNYFIKLVFYVSSFVFALVVYWADCRCITSWQWQFGVVAIFLSWINLIIFIAKFPLTGIYVIMLINVCITFLKVALLASLLVVAFSLSFYMAFREPAIVVSC